ncbi:sensor histidine kinase AruS-like [Cuculus canorus]|uniref:sensor histidine kinase AruS-like n=1 Tax=Cuculus canorus TaxID=55661 RepID=UPI0023AA690A|nr:sensor histidine kinase AruS-like [Cuculus canorus]
MPLKGRERCSKRNQQIATSYYDSTLCSTAAGPFSAITAVSPGRCRGAVRAGGAAGGQRGSGGSANRGRSPPAGRPRRSGLPSASPPPPAAPPPRKGTSARSARTCGAGRVPVPPVRPRGLAVRARGRGARREALKGLRPLGCLCMDTKPECSSCVETEDRKELKCTSEKKLP